MIKKVASNSNLPAEYSTDDGCHLEKFAILVHHTDEYILNADSRLIGDTQNNIQQLETLGYTVVSINPAAWKNMALSSPESKVLFITKLLRIANSDRASNYNVNDSRDPILTNIKLAPVT